MAFPSRLTHCLQVPVDDPRPLVTIQQACARTGVSRRTIYNWLYTGKLAWRRTAGGSIRIVEATLWAETGVPPAVAVEQALLAQAAVLKESRP